MRELEDLGFELADFMVTVNNERYDAEVAYSNRKSAALAKHGEKQRSVTVAKALAELDAEAEYREWLAKKSLYHHVEDIAKAISRKHFGLMNTNKGIQGMTASFHRRGT
jgi:hypothetical protein